MSRFQSFSPKQRRLLCWWCPGSPWKERRGIICDGAVRSGKTLCMSLSFVLWSFSAFSGESFALCGRTLGGIRRNLVHPLTAALEEMGFSCREKVSRNYLEISWKRQTNRYYLFSGKDEASAALIQGMTLAGVMFDEAALMPRSFVEQAVARCSVEGAKLWFNCNPDNPAHWFYQEWIAKASQKGLAYLHFTMEDNPSLSEQVRRQYQELYSGAFYQRFVLGEWSAAQGAVYPMFCESRHVVSRCPACERYYISCDYGTVNPTSMGLWGELDGVWYRLKEYYHASRETGEQKTDEEYYWELERLAEGFDVRGVVVDPAAASFIQCIRRHGRFIVLPGKNDVLAGIRTVGDYLKQDRLKFHQSCKDILREFFLYRWDEKAGRDLPVKENDHAMDEMRYLVMTVAQRQEEGGFFALAARREDEDF